MSKYANMTVDQKVQMVDLLIETKDQVLKIAELQAQVKLMSITEERLRKHNQGFQKSQSVFIDEAIAQDDKIEALEAKIRRQAKTIGEYQAERGQLV